MWIPRASSVALFALSFASAAAAGPLAPTKPSQLVTARAVSTPCPLDSDQDQNDPYQITSMTTVDGIGAPFTIPPNQVLVITHVHLTTSGAPANTDVQLFLLSINGQDGGVLAEGWARTTAGGVATADLTLPTGIPLRNGNIACAGASSGASFATITGFFTKDR